MKEGRQAGRKEGIKDAGTSYVVVLDTQIRPSFPVPQTPNDSAFELI